MRSRMRFIGGLGLVVLTMQALAAGSPAMEVPSETWAPTGNMAQARSGASAALLQDGSVLIAGGADGDVSLASAELFKNGSLSATGSMLLDRSNAAAVALKDGRVLITGGSTASGPTSETEIYDPATGSWTIGNSMAASRWGHTATLLADGRVLIAGGQGSGAPGTTLEIFDAATGSFSLAGVLTTARSSHAAALLPDNRVLIAGGSDGSQVLKSTEIFDPVSGSVSSGPDLSTQRAAHSATALLNGSVLIAGGSDGSQDRASAELLPRGGAAFIATGNMASPRRSHSAFLLSDNNSVLIVGGSADTAEQYRPWSRAFVATGAPAEWRGGAAGSPLLAEGMLFMAGGTSPSAELYGFPTVKTDKNDYAPGTLVRITGSGWQPGERVTLTLLEDPLIDTHPTVDATADASGRIVNYEFAPDHDDIGVRFYLTATGSVSQAQNTFTDGIQSIAVTFPANGGTYNASTYSAGGGNVNGTVHWDNNTTDSGRAVAVSIGQGSGNYWNGSAFSSATEVFNAATGSFSGNGDKTWTYAFALPPDGSYTARARGSQQGATDVFSASNTFTIENTAPITASVTAPVNGTVYGPTTMPATFSGSAADNSGGVGLAVNSTTFTLQRPSDNFYWTGTTWQSAVFNLATTHSATSSNTAVTWTSSATLPTWSTQTDGTYTVQAKATDAAGNTFTGTAITFTLDKTAPTASVTTPATGSNYTAATVPATFSGTAADNSGGAGLNANSTTFTLQRSSDSFYWTGSAWQAGAADLATTHSTTTGNTAAAWTSSVTLPTWASESDGTYTVQAKATDKVGNTCTGTGITCTLDNTAPVTASVTTPAGGSTYAAASV